MNNQWIESFVCVAQTGSVSKAAEILFLAQPTVTNRIQVLENELKEKLFVRTNRRMILTNAGQAFLPHALKMIDNWQKGIESIYQLRQQNEGSLTIAIFYNAIARFSPYIISFLDQYPNIKLSVKTRHSEEVVDLVFNRLAHVGIARSMHHDAFDSEILVKDSIALVVHPEHPFAQRKDIQLEDLKHEKVIMFYSGAKDLEWLDSELEGKKFAFDYSMESDNIEMITSLILEKKGIALIPKHTVDPEIESGRLVAIDVCTKSEGYKRNVELIWLKENGANYLTKLFVSHMLSNK